MKIKIYYREYIIENKSFPTEDEGQDLKNLSLSKTITEKYFWKYLPKLDIGNLCFDVVFEILTFLSRYERQNISLVSKMFNKMTSSSYFWRELIFCRKEAQKINDSNLAVILNKYPVEVLHLENLYESSKTCFRKSFSRTHAKLKKVILNYYSHKGEEIFVTVKNFNQQIEISYEGKDENFIWVKTVDGKTYYVNVPHFDITFFDLKVIVYEKFNIPIVTQRYIFAGIESRTGDNDKLGAINIQTGSTVHLILRLRG